MKKTGSLLIALALFILFSAACKKQPERPNVVLIVVDALRPDHLPFYGYPKDTAPFLNTLSRQSSVFLNAYAASTWTDPATVSLLTSLYPFQHGVNTGNRNPTETKGDDADKQLVSAVADSITTMAEVLKTAGYRTFGLSANFFVSPERGYDQGFDYFHNFPMKTDAGVLKDKLSEWDGEMRQGPYFLYIHYTDVHAPYTRRAPFYSPQKQHLEDTISAYDSNISYVDAEIGALYSRLNWDRDTLLIVTADHGEEFLEHGYRGHGHNLYNVALRIPLLVYLPQGDRAGRRIQPNVSAVDILPTISECLGREPDSQMEGRSLLPAMRGKPGYLVGRPIYVYIDRGPYRYCGILRDDWKLVMTLEGDKAFLYDLKADPGEKNNLAETAQEMDRRLEMARQYQEFEKSSRKYEQKLVQIEFSPKQLEELRALGYVN